MATPSCRTGATRNTPGPAAGSRNRGQALTEFILVFPLFFLLLLGVVQLSMLTFAQQTVHYAAFAAARAAIVRPCAAFHPDHDDADHFTPAVFTAAVLATLAAAPPRDLGLGDLPYNWLPYLPDGLQGMDASYVNAAYLTAVTRVLPDFGEDPVVWDAVAQGPGPGWPCADWDMVDHEYEALDPQQQNVPPPTHDLTLEVTFLYPMRIPIVNRVFYGIFVNFRPDALPGISLDPIDPDGEEEDVMVRPLRTLPAIGRYRASVADMVDQIMNADRFGFPGVAAGADIGGILDAEAWYPLPIRARCTLTVEGAIRPMVGFFPWAFLP